MYDRDWPIWTDQIVAAPAKFVHDEDGRRGMAISSLISQDCIVSGALARRSLLFTGVKMGSFSSVDEAVILPYCNIGRGAQLSRVIIDSGRAHSRRAGGGGRSDTRCQAFPPHGKGRVPDHQGDDRKAQMTLKVLSVASEAVPLIKTGGLADVAGALPAAVAPHGIEMTTLLPGLSGGAAGNLARARGACLALAAG